MTQKGIVVLTFDAPDTPEFGAWVQGPHMEDVGRIPGVVRVRRYEITEGPPDRRAYLVVLESEDLPATIAYRKSEAYRRPIQESIDHGVTNGYSLYCREIFSKTFG